MPMNWDNWEGREWAFAQLGEANFTPLLANVAPIIAMPAGENAQMLGTSFIVPTEPGQALCITAAHVLDDARRALGLPETKARSYAPGFAPKMEMDKELTASANRGELRVHIVIDGKADLATVKNAAMLRPFDVATLVIGSGLFGERSPAMALNSDIQPPGTRVIALGVQRTQIERRLLDDGREANFFRPHIEARAGLIREVHRRDPYMGLKAPAYELTLPIPHGMSGGPILLAPGDPQPGFFQAIGFASHDDATDAVVNDCAVPGRGVAIPVMAAYLLGAGTMKPPTMLELVHRHHINDLGKHWQELEIVNDGERIQYKQP
jgi:hypothetical protein